MRIIYSALKEVLDTFLLQIIGHALGVPNVVLVNSRRFHLISLS